MTREEIICLFAIIFVTILIFFIPVEMQFKSGVNNGAFKQIKIIKVAFMFRAPDEISV